MSDALSVIKDQALSYEQRIAGLARLAENQLNVLNYTAQAKDYFNTGVFCDLFEGSAPFRPRYILPDYELFMRQGSEFLRLSPPKTLLEATSALLILYRHIPSITNFPVYLGNLDTLLEPFITDEETDYPVIKQFLLHIDRTLTDSFVHANLGPHESNVGYMILKAERELQNAVPNLTIKFNQSTSDNFALEGVKTALLVSKPYFVNHDLYLSDYGESYGVASCYNGLPVGGGSYTLVRLNLKALALTATSVEEFQSRILPEAVNAMAQVIDERTRFLVEESGFFESNFLVKENLISKARFVSMFGIFGLAECVNQLWSFSDQSVRYGHSDRAQTLANAILMQIKDLLVDYKSPYSELTNGRLALHAQSLISNDAEVSAGCRIPIGEETELLDHILFTSPLHRFFDAGVSDIYQFDQTAQNNPQSVLDIIKGAMKSGCRTFALYSADSDLVRVTGFLVKKSELNQTQSLNDCVALGAESSKHTRFLERKVRSLS